MADLSLIQALEAFAQSHQQIHRMSPPTPLHVDGYRVQVQFGSRTLILRILEKNTPAHPHIYNPMPPREIHRMIEQLLAGENVINEVRDHQTELTRAMIDHLTDGWVFKHDAYGEGAALSRAGLAILKAKKEERTLQFQMVSARKGLLPSHLAKHIGDNFGGRKRKRTRKRARTRSRMR